MSIPSDVAGLIAESLAAHTRMRQGADAREETVIIREARSALFSLLAALALDPGRTLPVWQSVPPRESAALSDLMIAFYQKLDAEGVAEGL